ncbi:hypothetical protein [Pseudomonas fluorescens]|uniref:hypothetical protein n=1 Tax=Pseudomonas fluorescens TaxID=294 RepID=UPI001BEB2024|nr:hypothetical protein [Pseudomonas fluorescens]MBT2375799.1 hypothetical protein [Pseudomonas fluorescens]
MAATNSANNFFADREVKQVLIEREIDVFTRAERICNTFLEDLQWVLRKRREDEIATISLVLLNELMDMAERTENVVWETKYALKRALDRANTE